MSFRIHTFETVSQALELFFHMRATTSPCPELTAFATWIAERPPTPFTKFDGLILHFKSY